MYSTDLGSLVREKRWAALADLVHELPTASRTYEAVMNDPELARQILAAQGRDVVLDADSEDGDLDAVETAPGWHPKYREFDLHAKQLGDVINALAGINQAIVASAGGTARKVQPYPTPLTALPQAELEQARADGDAILAQLGLLDAVEHP